MYVEIRFICFLVISVDIKQKQRRTIRTFSVKEGVVELGHFDENFVKNTRKKGPTWRILEVFPLDILKTTF